MPVHNADIGRIFQEIADLLEIQGANPFRVRAYRNAAITVGECAADLAALVRSDRPLPRLPGIGDDLSHKIHEIAETGRCALLDRLHKALPHSVTELLQIPGLGPKRVRILHDELQVEDLDALRSAAAAGEIRRLHGFGAKTEQRILQALRARTGQARRYPLPLASQYAEPLAAALRRVKGVSEVTIAGSFRRRCATVGDIDILVTATPGSRVMQRFTGYDEVDAVQAQGDTRATVALRSGLQVDLRVVPPASYGAALVYFTGSKAHNIALRKRAQTRALKLNEYGVFRGRRRIAGATELSVYAALDLPWIAPELREDQGEIEWLQRAAAPRLVERGDLRGDLHCHSRASDGHASLRQMARAARQRGLHYLAITEHSQRLAVAHGLTPERLLKQIDEIDRLNESLDDITLLKGVEVDILADGTLDLPDPVLGRLDLVVAAVHSDFDLPRARQTRRLLRAMDHPHFSLLAHPTTREIDGRQPLQADWLRVIRHARERGCFLELNSQPRRLDLPDHWCRVAQQEGVLVAIDSDAHSVHGFDDLGWGVEQARRGWLTADDVLNTRGLRRLRGLLRQTM